MKRIRQLAPHPFDPTLAMVPLDDRGERFAVIDVADAATVGQYNWFALKNGREPYAARNIRLSATKRRTQYLHLFLWQEWGKTRPDRLDHANRNTLDCRRKNLRAATHRQNVWNSERRGESTPYKGVYLNARNSVSKYTAVIRDGKRQVWIGSFADASDAARAYDERARALRGEFAVLNFPAVN